MPQNSIELLQKLMEKYSRVFMSFAGVSYRITCNNGNQRTLINP